MSRQRLTDLCLISIERELSDTLLSNLSQLIDRFAKLKDRKLNLSVLYDLACRGSSQGMDILHDFLAAKNGHLSHI